MEQLSGFFKVLAKPMIEKQLTKPFLGKPYLRFGQCYILCTYFFQLGCILGAKHHKNHEEFGYAFLGMQGEQGSANKFFTEIEQGIMKDFDIESMKFEDYTNTVLRRQLGYTGDIAQFSVDYFMKKTSPETAIGYIWKYAIDGASLGVKNPDLISRIYHRSNFAVPKEDWDLVRAKGPDIRHLANSIGMDLPPEQDIMSYKESEDAINELFMEYCQKCCPEIYSIFVA